MAITWTLAGTLALLSLAAALAWQRAVDRSAWSTWDLAFGGARHTLIEWLKRDLARHLRVLDGALDVARTERERGQPTEAAHVLSVAETTAAVHVAVLQAWLRRSADVARSLAAIKPVPPLHARGMRLGPLRVLALGHRVGDAVLVTSGERFRWSKVVLAAGLGCVEWAFGASALRAQATPRGDQLERAFDDATHARADLSALNDHVVTTLEHLCVSLDAVDASSRN